MGEADEHSDVDFLVLTKSEVTAAQERALQEMHAELYALATPRAQHLEGSYAPKDRFRQVDVERTALLFLDNGASRLVRDSHCKTALVRWILRECGIALFGPPPQETIDPVSKEDLQEEARRALREYVEWAPEPTRVGRMSRWKQPYLVLTLCRILNTIETGRVASKHDAAEWARGNLDARWRPLIDRAVADRPDPSARTRQRADDGLIDETLAFGEYAMRREGL